MNSNLIKNFVFRFHFQAFLRHSQIEYQSNRRLNNHHLNQQRFFQIHQLQLNHSIRLMAFHLILKYVLKFNFGSSF
jgi:hypothetical protein